MNANLYLAQERIAEVRQETDHRTRVVRPLPPRRSLRDRLRGDHGC